MQTLQKKCPVNTHEIDRNITSSLVFYARRASFFVQTTEWPKK